MFYVVSSHIGLPLSKSSNRPNKFHSKCRKAKFQCNKSPSLVKFLCNRSVPAVYLSTYDF